MDPLKLTYGVKKPLNEKSERIKDYQDNNKRYYPTTIHGDVDEWGAVEKHRHEVYQRQLQESKIQKMQN